MFLDEGGSDFFLVFFAVFRFVVCGFGGGFHLFGYVALGLWNLSFQGFYCIGLGLEVFGNQVGIGYQGMVPASGNDGFQVIADGLPPVDEHAGTLEFVQHGVWGQFLF